ncbi:MAG: VOC family protein [Chloroflexi bacterium]|nr:VOC family protein [Chloroflexota bacterium]
MFAFVHHVAVVVPNINEAIDLFQNRFRLKLLRRETIASSNMELAIFAAGATHVEVMQPIKPEGSLQAFLDKNGPGIQHVSFAVHDLDGEAPGLLATGLRFSQGEKATVTSVGWKNLSVVPGSAYGISGLEMTEPALDKRPT